MFFKASKANEGSEELEEAKQNFKELGPIIDTSLLKAYLHTNNNLVGSLLRLPNFCHVKESEKMLNEHKVFLFFNAQERILSKQHFLFAFFLSNRNMLN